MSDRSKIGWTDATWNPVTGCTKVSAGCDRCYAAAFTNRWRGTPGHYFEDGFEVKLRPEKLALPLRWQRPRRIFTTSLSDLFHDQVPDELIAKVFAVMAITSRHTHIVLTKRPGRMRSLLNDPGFPEMIMRADLTGVSDSGGWDRRWTGDPWPLPNVWLGVSAEDERWSRVRVPLLLGTAAATRFVSAEPLLGPVDLTRYLPATTHPNGAALDWVIVGGESGPGARRMDPSWAEAVQQQCAAGGAAFFFKQLGTVLASEWGLRGKGDRPEEWHHPWALQQYPGQPESRR